MFMFSEIQIRSGLVFLIGLTIAFTRPSAFAVSPIHSFPAVLLIVSTGFLCMRLYP
jgi:hypothetical protein